MSRIVLFSIPLALVLEARAWLSARRHLRQPIKPRLWLAPTASLKTKPKTASNGFDEVTGLRKDDQGIWRANAKQGDKQVNVSLDFRGNVVAQ